jgi:multimeric flavodoxin WrbA
MARTLKVIGIQGSPHADGMTAALVDRALAGAAREGAETRLVRLAEEELRSCQACGGDCWGTQACARDRVATQRHARLQDADGVVFGVPVYCWQVNALSALFIDKMRWNTGSVLEPRNRRAAFGIACAGGSGTGCVIALQALYRYFYNWAFTGVAPLPVTRFNYTKSLDAAEEGGALLARTLRAGIEPFPTMGHAMLHCESLPYMKFGLVDELAFIVEQLRDGLASADDPGAAGFFSDAEDARQALGRGDRDAAAAKLSAAYHAGARLWEGLEKAGLR